MIEDIPPKLTSRPNSLIQLMVFGLKKEYQLVKINSLNMDQLEIKLTIEFTKKQKKETKL